MPFVLLAPLVVVAAVVALALGVPGRQVLAWAGGAVGALVVLTVVSVVGVVLLEGDDGGAPGRSAPVPVRRVDAHLSPPRDEPFPDPVAPLDGLADGDTVLVRIEADRPVTLHQCPADRVEPRSCAPGIPAATGRGAGDVALVQVHEAYQAGGRTVDCQERACVLAALGGDGRVLAARPILFGGAGPQPVVHSPPVPVVPGESVVVRLRSLPPGSTGAVTLCVPGELHRGPACGAPAPEVPFRADASGAASVELPIEPGPVAGGAGRCERRSPCAIGVIGSPVATPFAPVRFAPPPGAEVPVERASAGLAAALILAAAATVIVRRTDWEPPGGDPFAGVPSGQDPFADIDLDEDPRW